MLGSAAGGGFPQWNCGCANCRGIRSGTIRAAPRSQAQLALSADNQHWFLLGASPDLRYQIESFSELHPRNSGRNSPICGVVLACADLDHTLGLLLLREWHQFDVYSTGAVRHVLLDGNSIFRLLERMPGQVRWHDVPPGSQFALMSRDGCTSGISITFVPLPGNLPAYARGGQNAEAVSALIVQSPAGVRLAYVPGLPALTDALEAELAGCDVILIDGTFWTDDELVRSEPHGKPARDIGHLAVSSPQGSMTRLQGLKSRRIYIHINNTNPMLDEDSPQYRHLREAGWELAYDGMELQL